MTSAILAYNRAAAVAYAKTWALSRNPAYYDFENLGGDCTNFASQCLYAGSKIMNYAPTFGWYYLNLSHRAPAWTGVEFLYNFLTGNSGAGPFATEVALEQCRPGDILQLATEQADYHHTPIVLSTGERPAPPNILLAAHSYDALNKPLSTYNYHKLRVIHIEGVRTTQRF